MTDEVLSSAIKKLLHSDLVQSDIQFLWHAGEPLLVGIDFYRKMMEIVRGNNYRGINVRHALQTNATLITDEWCEFFNANQFSLGISVDGPASIHNVQRKNWNGKASHSSVMAGYKQLKDHGIQTGAICVLTENSLHYPNEIFEFYATNGFTSVAFNVEEVENANLISSFSGRTEASIISDYRRFIETIFNLQQQTFPRIEVRELNLVYDVLSRKRQSPSYVRIAAEVLPLNIITILKNGDISTYCPEFAGVSSDEYNNFVIGNVLTNQLEDIAYSQSFLKIRNDVDQSIAMCAASCKYFDFCGSAPLSNKFAENGTLLSTETLSCKLSYQTLTDVLVEKAMN